MQYNKRMMLFGLMFLLLVLGIIFIFASPRLSPIPYFPTNNKDLAQIIRVLNLKNNLTVVDLGAGDGTVIFRAAHEAIKRNINTLFVAVEINPILILILFIKKLFHPNRKNINIVWEDMYKINFKVQMSNVKTSKNTMVFYLYISPRLLDKTAKLIRSISINTRIVSYMYPILSFREKEKIIPGVNRIYLYNI